jgi:hypothetical protein
MISYDLNYYEDYVLSNRYSYYSIETHEKTQCILLNYNLKRIQKNQLKYSFQMDREVDRRKILVLFAKKILISIRIQNAKVNSNHQ